MRSSSEAAPSLNDFITKCRIEFGFLKEYGFEEIEPQRRRDSEPFQFWFAAGDRYVVITGEGHGTNVGVHLEHASGVRMALVYLVPKENRSTNIRSRRRRVRSQLDQIGLYAEQLQAFGIDFLSGNLEQFLQVAQPLPSYLGGSGTAV